MAGDWIKMRADLQTHPKVVRMASALNADKLRVIGGLHAVWCLFDTHSEDGSLDGYTLKTLDDHVVWPGFSAAMKAIKWLDTDGESLVLPEFDEHNGQSAKRRAQETKRKRDDRKVSASDADKKRSREEKRRTNTPHTPQGGKTAAVSLKAWLEDIKAKGEKAIPEDDAVFAYADEVGIPVEFLSLAWREFRHRYTQPDAKRYRDWRAVFRKAVRGNWLKLWWLDGQQYAMTTVGMQAQRAHGEKAA